MKQRLGLYIFFFKYSLLSIPKTEIVASSQKGLKKVLKKAEEEE